MRLVLVDNFAGTQLGGGEVYLASIARTLAADGHDIMVIAARGSGFSAAMRKAGHRVEELDFRVRESSSDMSSITDAITSWAGEKPVVVQGSGFYTSWLASRAARENDTVVGTVQTEPAPDHGSITGTVKRIARSRMRAYMLSRIDAVLTIAPALADQLAHLGYATVTVVRPGIDAEGIRERVRAVRARTGDRDEVTIGYLGRLKNVKGPDVLVDAAYLLAQEERPRQWHVLMAGAGSLERRVGTMIERRMLVEDVELLGYVATEELLGRVDVLVAPSRSEGLNLAVLEAQAADVLVVATDVGGMAESVADGRGIVAAEPTPLEVARALGAALELVGTPEAEVMCARAHERVVDLFGWERFEDDVREFYSGLAQSSS